MFIRFMSLSLLFINMVSFANSDCSDFDCTIYSDWKGACLESTCKDFKCEWTGNSCKNALPLPPSSEGSSCGTNCFKVPVIYKKRSVGQALDKALSELDAAHKKICSSSFVSARIGKTDVNIIYLANGSINGPAEYVEVRQSYICAPW